MLVERIERKFFKDIAPKGIHYIKPVNDRDAQGLVAIVYDQMRREFQLVPPITIHAAVPELLAGVGSMIRESMVAGGVSRAEREAIPAAPPQRGPVSQQLAGLAVGSIRFWNGKSNLRMFSISNYERLRRRTANPL